MNINRMVIRHKRTMLRLHTRANRKSLRFASEIGIGLSETKMKIRPQHKEQTNKHKLKASCATIEWEIKEFTVSAQSVWLCRVVKLGMSERIENQIPSANPSRARRPRLSWRNRFHVNTTNLYKFKSQTRKQNAKAEKFQLNWEAGGFRGCDKRKTFLRPTHFCQTKSTRHDLFCNLAP